MIQNLIDGTDTKMETDEKDEIMDLGKNQWVILNFDVHLQIC